MARDLKPTHQEWNYKPKQPKITLRCYIYIYIYIYICVSVFACVGVRLLKAQLVLCNPLLPVSLSVHRWLNRYPHQVCRVRRPPVSPDTQQNEEQDLSKDGGSFSLNGHQPGDVEIPERVARPPEVSLFCSFLEFVCTHCLWFWLPKSRARSVHTISTRNNLTRFHEIVNKKKKWSCS